MTDTGRYPVLYFSESKKQEMRIEDMPSPHITNAWRKLGGADLSITTDLEVRAAMWDELVERGCKFDVETGQWVFPERVTP